MSGAWADIATQPWSPPARRTVVVSPHPDDETLGAGGLIAHQRRAGLPVVVVAVTDGEAAYPHHVEPGELGPRRRSEQEAALVELGVDVGDVVRLGWPDGTVVDHEDDLAAQLAAIVRPDDLVVAPWVGDHHPDHEACGRAAVRAAATRRAELVGSLIWAPVRRPVTDAPSPVLELRLDIDLRAARARAVAAHRTQLCRMGGDDPIVGAELLIRDDREWFVAGELAGAPAVDRTAPAFFEGYYRSADDPWSFGSDVYETRRYAALVDQLGPGPLGAVFEPGCSIGVLTARLAERAERVVAIDVAPSAIAHARLRLAGRPGVELTVGGLPGDQPPGPFDVVVFSELGYYFDDATLTVVVDGLVASLRPHGRLVAGHWLGESIDHTMSGAAVHARIDAHPALRRVARPATDGFVLDEWCRR